MPSDLRDTVTIVYPHHADWAEGHVPVVAPLGTALLGMRVGDIAHHRGAWGIQAWEVEKVLYQPEAAGDHHL
jgi:regulator of nucleoside diphosphate kinase